MKSKQLSQYLFDWNIRLTGFLLAAFLILSGETVRGNNIPNSKNVVIVIHPDNQISNLKIGDLSKIYLKKKMFFKSGEIITPIDYRPMKASFYEGLLKKNLSRIRRFWIKAIFSGKGTPPVEFRKISKLISFLRNNSGGIAYVPSDTNIKGLKTIKIIP